MGNSIYQSLLSKSVDTVEITDDTKELIVSMVSCMCDNKAKVGFKRDPDGDISIRHYNNHCGLSLSNLQLKRGGSDELRWAFLENDINEIVMILNSGTSRVESMKKRG